MIRVVSSANPRGIFRENTTFKKNLNHNLVAAFFSENVLK
jgi:hypothetical protein